VLPVNPHETSIEGLPVFGTVLDIPGTVDMATMYVPPDVGAGIVEQLAQKGVSEVWFNPGSESPELVERAGALGLAVVEACSVIGIGDTPSRY
jgi:uncharacterized protein